MLQQGHPLGLQMLGPDHTGSGWILLICAQVGWPVGGRVKGNSMR